ncbi:MAG: hypothetical protein P8Q97_08055 [Myxococcota bacterium]|nr:hypothetical protein [Myxococcota bacterium]
MVEFARIPPGSAKAIRAEAREQLGQLGQGLRVIAEDVMGLTSSIDLLAVDPDGGLVAILIASEPDQEPALLGRGIAHRAWADQRAKDWCTLAPELAIAWDRPARCILLAPDFGEETRLAARTLGSDTVLLVRYLALRAGKETGLLLEPLAHLPEPGRAAPSEPTIKPLPRSPTQEMDPLPEFRSKLADRDLRTQRAPTPLPAG